MYVESLEWKRARKRANEEERKGERRSIRRKIHRKTWCKLHNVMNKCFPFSRCFTASLMLLSELDPRVERRASLFLYCEILRRDKSICNHFQYTVSRIVAPQIVLTLPLAFPLDACHSLFLSVSLSPTLSMLNRDIIAIITICYRFASNLTVQICKWFSW